MASIKKITRSNFFIRLSSWEYWPFGIIQFPLMLYFGWLALRARSLFFFSASNPGIPMGGMFGESKFEVLQKISPEIRPKTVLVRLPASRESVAATLRENEFRFPLIFKPDLGERGHMVERINNESEMDSYLKRIRTDFLIQDLVELPLEFGIFYRRYPSQSQGEVISIIQKEMLSVTGDGRSSLRDLILEKPRAKLQWDKLKVSFRYQLDAVIPNGREIQLVDIGNHARGTKFKDGSHLITTRLSATFDSISKTLDGFYFGRFDLRCSSLEDLYEGRVRILELNGCGAEPAHIYDPDFGLVKAMGVLFRYWRDIFVISRENRQRGICYLSTREGIRYFKKFKAATR